MMYVEMAQIGFLCFQYVSVVQRKPMVVTIFIQIVDNCDRNKSVGLVKRWCIMFA